MKTSVKVGRRCFLKLLAFVSIAPVAPFSCGNTPGAMDKTAINSLLLHLLGIEDYHINLFDRIKELNDEFFDQTCVEVLDYISARYQTSSGIDFKMFLDDLNTGGPADADEISYLVEILKTNAIMASWALLVVPRKKRFVLQHLTGRSGLGVALMYTCPFDSAWYYFHSTSSDSATNSSNLISRWHFNCVKPRPERPEFGG